MADHVFAVSAPEDPFFVVGIAIDGQLEDVGTFVYAGHGYVA